MITNKEKSVLKALYKLTLKKDKGCSVEDIIGELDKDNSLKIGVSESYSHNTINKIVKDIKNNSEIKNLLIHQDKKYYYNIKEDSLDLGNELFLEELISTLSNTKELKDLFNKVYLAKSLDIPLKVVETTNDDIKCTNYYFINEITFCGAEIYIRGLKIESYGYAEKIYININDLIDNTFVDSNINVSLVNVYELINNDMNIKNKKDNKKQKEQKDNLITKDMFKYEKDLCYKTLTSNYRDCYFSLSYVKNYDNENEDDKNTYEKLDKDLYKKFGKGLSKKYINKKENNETLKTVYYMTAEECGWFVNEYLTILWMIDRGRNLSYDYGPISYSDEIEKEIQIKKETCKKIMHDKKLNELERLYELLKQNNLMLELKNPFAEKKTN